MILTIETERDLPAQDFNPDFMPKTGLTLEYIRHAIDPRVMIACRTGQCYARADGQRWKHSGWKVTREEDGRVTHAMGFCKDDHKVYDYAQDAHAA
jgi:hypothetical protein